MVQGEWRIEVKLATIATMGLLATASGATAQDTATEEMRQRIVEQRLYEACVRLYAQDRDGTIVMPTCYEAFIRFGLPD